MPRATFPWSRVVAAAFGIACAVAPHARADFIDHLARTDDIGVLKVPHEGETHVLVIPLIIDDQPFEDGDEQTFLDELDAFYGTGPGTFQAYYEQVSLGRFSPRATVAPAVHVSTCPTLGAYANCEIPRGAGFSTGDTLGAVEVVKDALALIDQVLVCATAGPSGDLPCTSGGGVDLHSADASGPTAGTPDGVVDGIILVSNAAFPGIAFPVKDLSTEPLLAFAGPFPSFTYGGVTVGAVAIAGRQTRPARATLVSVHEFGHLLGFCDLYNESNTTTDMPYTLMGGWSYSSAPSLLDAWSRAAIGWADVRQVAASGTFTLSPANDRGTVLKVGTGDEFFMVELRVRSDAVDGDLGVPAGVLVERVRLSKQPSPTRGQYFNTLQSCVNCTAFDTFLSVEQADGAFDLENKRARSDGDDLFLAGDSIGPSDDTAARSLAHPVFSTNRIDGAPTGVRIAVTAVSDTSATVEVTVDPVADPCAEIAEICGELPCVEKDGAGVCGALPPEPADDTSQPPAPAPFCACARAGHGAFTAWAVLGFVVLTVVPGGRRRWFRG